MGLVAGDIQAKITQGVLFKGATHVAFADLTSIRDFRSPILREVSDNPIVSSFPRAISLGIGLSGGIVNLLHIMDSHSVSQTYHYHIYKVINQRLDQIALWVMTVLQNSGFSALPLPSSQYRFKDFSDDLRAVFPHKTAAYLGGMGWIGKNCLLVTENVGPALRLATVLTDAPLVTGTPHQNLCGECRECVSACPANAIKGKEFNPNADRDDRIDVWKCDEFRSEREKKFGNRSCGLCISVCPFFLRSRGESADR